MVQTEQDNRTMKILISDESERISRILEFLTYSGIDAEKIYDSEADIYQLTVPEKQLDKAVSLLRIYMEQEPDEESEIDTEDEEPKGTVYVGVEERYKDNSSSASAFLGVSILIAALLVLCTLDILPLPLTFAKQPMMFIGLCVIAITFLVIGLISMKKAGDYKAQMASELELETKAITWFTDTYTGEQLDHTIEASEGELPRAEILCLKRLALIRDYLLREYPNLSGNHADALSETIYQKLFEE